MKTPFTSKDDMISELQTEKRYIETLVHHSYDIGFAEGCRYCEKTVYERILESINKYKSYHNGAHWTVLKEIKEKIEAMNGAPVDHPSYCDCDRDKCCTMTYEQNVRAVLETCFTGFKDEVIDMACRNICALKEGKQNEQNT